MLRVGWFSTGRGEGSRGLLRFVRERLTSTGIDAAIEFVFSNREPGEAEGSDQFFELTRSFGLPLVTHSSSRFRRGQGGRFSESREEYDRQVMGLLADRTVDVCVLAGYMLIVGGAMCRAFPLLNLHPALPDGPTGTWQQVVWRLIEDRATHTGAMTHLATEVVDRGPVVSYYRIPITGPSFDGHWSALEGSRLDDVRETHGEEFPLFRLIRREQYRREPYLLFETIRALSEGAVVIRQGTVVDSGGRPLGESSDTGLCLDREIEIAMAADSSQP